MKTNEIPDRFPAQAIDKVVVGLRGIGEMVMHMELEFDRRLDAERLSRAFDLVLDAEPILGCRFIIRPIRTYWQRLPRDRRSNFLVASTPEEYRDFLDTALDPENGPQLTGCLWRDGRTDRLLLKITHEAADSGGLKEAAGSLARIYSALGKDPGYAPKPNLNGSRSILQILKRVPAFAFPRIILNHLVAQIRLLLPARGFGFRVPGAASGRPVYLVRHLAPERVAGLADYGRSRGATLNDMFMAAFFRALAHCGGWDGVSRLQSIMTVDQRLRHMPDGRGEAVCNLSSVETILLGTRLGTGFAETLDLVSRAIGRRKASWFGLGDFVCTMPTIRLFPTRWVYRLFNRFFASLVRRISLMNSLTNLGPIRIVDVDFDGPAVKAWITPPPVFPPVLLLGLSGYAGGLTLSTAVYDSPGSRSTVEALLDKMLAELP